MRDLHAWAVRQGVSAAALQELHGLLVGQHESITPPPNQVGRLSETAVAQRYRLEQSAAGVRLWRNNVGALADDTGRFVRFGLANESAAMSRSLKSGDYIGITPHIVVAADVGRKLGIFTSREIKREGWRFTGAGREAAQLAWAKLVVGLGGLASFVHA